jgi:hypothetical protein
MKIIYFVLEKKKKKKRKKRKKKRKGRLDIIIIDIVFS